MLTQESDSRQVTVVLSREIIMTSEHCRREGNKTRFKMKLEEKICNMIVWYGAGQEDPDLSQHFSPYVTKIRKRNRELKER